jgi:hypothetical protein
LSIALARHSLDNIAPFISFILLEYTTEAILDEQGDGLKDIEALPAVIRSSKVYTLYPLSVSFFIIEEEIVWSITRDKREDGL